MVKILNMDEPFDIDSFSQDSTETQTSIYSYIKAILRSSDTVPEKVVKLSDEIRNGSHTVENPELYTWDLWMVILEIAVHTPPDHPWQDSIIAALQRLQKWGGYIGRVNEDKALEWRDLPELGPQLRDVWFDPTTLEDFTTEQVQMWKNLNSFVARLTAPTFAPWWNFPMWAIRSALEESMSVSKEEEGKKDTRQANVHLETNLWTATEWLIRPSGIVVFEEMTSPEPLDEVSRRIIKPGALCPELPSRGPKRLTFWKTRLLEFVDQEQALGLSSDLVDRLARSAQEIEKFENSRPIPAKEAEAGSFEKVIGESTKA